MIVMKGVIVSRFCPNLIWDSIWKNVCELNKFKRDFKNDAVEPAKVFKGILKLSEF
jgi:hypothetical protein